MAEAESTTNEVETRSETPTAQDGAALTGMAGAGASTAVAHHDEGTAIIEFIFASVVLLIPVIYLMLTLSQMQAAGYATSTSATSASRIAARDAHPSEDRARSLATMHFDDFGLHDVGFEITYSCAGPCGEAGSVVTAHVRTRVPLPGFPLLFGSEHAPHVTMTASHSDVVASGRED